MLTLFVLSVSLFQEPNIPGKASQLQVGKAAQPQERPAERQKKVESPNQAPVSTTKEPDYPTALYYTFSTISQTIAGVLGFLGAFLLFRYGNINKSLSENVQALVSHGNFAADHTLQALFQHGNMGEIVSRFDNPAWHGQLPPGLLNVTLPLARRLLVQQQRMYWSMLCAVGWSILSIIGSVAVMGLTPTLASSNAPMLLLAGNIVLALDLVLMAVLLVISLS